MNTIIGRDGQIYPVPTKEELRKHLEIAALNDERWNNYGVSSVCKYALERIEELEALTQIEDGNTK